MFVGVKKGMYTEYAVPSALRWRWLHAGGRVLRDEPGVDPIEPMPLVEYRSAHPCIEQPDDDEEQDAPRRGRPPGSKTRRGSEGGETKIVERVR